MRVLVTDVRREGGFEWSDFLVVELPADPAARKALFAVDLAIMKQGANYDEPTPDRGQRYLCLWYDDIGSNPAR